MQLVINGITKDINNNQTIADMVKQFSKTDKHLIAELNGTIIPTDAWGSTSLKAGDALELVAFVGGG
jgi:sulfur carrier protein